MSFFPFPAVRTSDYHYYYTILLQGTRAGRVCHRAECAISTRLLVFVLAPLSVQAELPVQFQWCMINEVEQIVPRLYLLDR